MYTRGREDMSSTRRTTPNSLLPVTLSSVAYVTPLYALSTGEEAHSDHHSSDPSRASTARGLSALHGPQKLMSPPQRCRPALDESDYQSIPVPPPWKLKDSGAPPTSTSRCPGTATRTPKLPHPEKNHVALYRKHFTLEGDLKKMLSESGRIAPRLRRLRNRNLRVG